MTHVIETVDANAPLAPQVWEHEARARERGLELVVELHLDKEPLSRAIGRLWKKDRALTAETLEGIFLLRIDLARVGPKAAVALTPYALFGVPSFIAWNPLGQVLTRGAFKSRQRSDLVLALSAYFHDVAHHRKHELHPAPKIPEGVPLAPQREKPRPKAPPSEKPAVSTPPTATPAPQGRSPAVEQLARGLSAFLDNALAVAREFLRRHDLRDDLSLHSLRQLDAHLDEHPVVAGSEVVEGRHLAALGVYLGSVVAANTEARWFVDEAQASPIDALALQVTTAGEARVFRPVQIALQRLHDTEQGFYGHAIAMCRKV